MLRLPYELFLMLRYLRPKRTYVSVITLISIVGVMLGVAVLIVVISVMSGFDREWRDKILGFNAHLRVTADSMGPGSGLVEDYRRVLDVAHRHPEVAGAAPYVLAQVLAKTITDSGKEFFFVPFLRGVDPELEGTVSVLPESLLVGSFDPGYRDLIIGSGFADGMPLGVGDRLLIYSPQNFKEFADNPEDAKSARLPTEYTISGIFDVGFADYNRAFVVSSLESAQDLYELGDAVHGIHVKLNDPFRAPWVQRDLREELGPAFRVLTWQEENEEIFGALVTEKNMMFFLLFFIMIVAAFGIMSTLITFVVQKTREIGILKALGATRGQVLGVFLSQGVFVGIVGVACGFSLGMLAIHYRNEFLHFMNSFTGRDLLPVGIYKIHDLPVLIVPVDIALICGGSLVICILAGLLPALKAAWLNPVEALHHE
jgi:lipoprotein-releasing system permease protein